MMDKIGDIEEYEQPEEANDRKFKKLKMKKYPSRTEVMIMKNMKKIHFKERQWQSPHRYETSHEALAKNLINLRESRQSQTPLISPIPTQSSISSPASKHEERVSLQNRLPDVDEIDTSFSPKK